MAAGRVGVADAIVDHRRVVELVAEREPDVAVARVEVDAAPRRDAVLVVAERGQALRVAVVALAADDEADLEAIRLRVAADAALGGRRDERLARAARQIDDAAGGDLAARQRLAVAHDDA